MKRQKLRIILKLFYSLLGVLITTTNSHATWSIIAVDRTTGEDGIAGASCTYNVQGIGRSIPGKGVVVVQAKSNSNARKLGIKLMGEGVNPEQIIEAIRDKQFDPENQQYGVVVLYNDIAPATYSGKRIINW